MTCSSRSRRFATAAALGAVCSAATLLPAQAPAQQPASQSRSLAQIADSIAFAGDTARAVAMLDSAVRADKRDGASWHQLGILLWHQVKSKRSGGNIGDINVVRTLSAADSSLRMATQVSPDSTRYWMSLSEFNASSGVATSTFASGGQAVKALEAAEKSGDRLAAAKAADAAGVAAWRRYEPVAKRALASDQMQVDIQSMRRDQAVDYLDLYFKRIEPPTGNADYQAAVALFRRAIEADPTNLRIARHFYMALGEREQWEEMRSVARQRLAQYPLDWQSQMARGLAAHRLGHGMEAQVAFDSALMLMDDERRERMTSLQRLLRPNTQFGDPRKKVEGVGDAEAYNRLPERQRQAFTALYWLMADPLAMTPENEHRNEFLARVAWADFRWTSEDHDLLGADTDRGDIFIRYGPPKKDMLIPGNSSNTPGAGNTIAWVYEGQQAFFFDMMPGFLSARTAFYDKDFVDQMKYVAPVDFSNVPTTRSLDTIPVITSRFRAGRDSVDVVVAASIPVDSMLQGLAMDRAPVDVDVRVFDRYAQIRAAERAQSTYPPDSVVAPVKRSWVKRVGPGLNLLRVEALQADSRRAARSVSRVESDLGTGFGMSDILLGSAPEPRGGMSPRSWRDVETAPAAGSFTNGQIGMVWEIYELTNSDGQAKYRIDVAVERVSKGIRSFTARILGREVRGTNRLSFAFDRSAPAASTLVEFMTVNLADATEGEYRLRVTIMDQATRRTTERLTTFHIR